jgi:capping protein alpha
MSDDISDEQKVEIATSFLLASPPGEFNEVASDVRRLVGNDDLLNRHFAAAAQEYNTDQMVYVEPSYCDYKVLLTKFNEIDSTTYLDPRSKKTVSVDHIKKTVGSVQDGPAPAANEAHRAAIEEAVLEYVKEFFSNGALGVYSSPDGVVVCISAPKFSPGNFWNGRWRSTWKINFRPGGDKATLEGNVKLAVHFYEDGNVQLSNEHKKTTEIDIGNPTETAEAVAHTIRSVESEYEAAVEETYNNMDQGTFKGLRRKLPITGNKFEWEKQAGYRLGKEVSAK